MSITSQTLNKLMTDRDLTFAIAVEGFCIWTTVRKGKKC